MQPGRLTGVVVDKSDGVPYLAAGQVFEARPRPRRWLSLSGTVGADDCFVEDGTILVTRSGTVGRVTVAHSPHLNIVVTDDLLRVTPIKRRFFGWLYSYMRTEFFRSIAVAANYGHMIKHLDPSHLTRMPVIDVSNEVQKKYSETIEKVFSLRSGAHAAVKEAEDLYATSIGLIGGVPNSTSFITSHRDLAVGRRRLDAYHHNFGVSEIISRMRANSLRVETLDDACDDIFLPTRFKRYFGDNATPYRSGEELFDLNPPVTKRVYAGLVTNSEDYILRAGLLVMACSGQIYGLNGSVMLLNDSHEGIFGTHDLIRIVPASKIRAGYLLAVLGHPQAGRPIVIAQAYGTSIPHLDPVDVRRVPVPRLTPEVEDRIADAMDSAADMRARADLMENAAIAGAEHEIAAFMHSKAVSET
jgi:type I restriction enzyme, S subunit